MSRQRWQAGPTAVSAPIPKASKSQAPRSENQYRKPTVTLRTSGNAVLKTTNSAEPPKPAVTEAIKGGPRNAGGRAEQMKSTLAQAGQMVEKKTLPEQMGKATGQPAASSLAKTPSKGNIQEQRLEAAILASEKSTRPPLSGTPSRLTQDRIPSVLPKDISQRPSEKTSLASAGSTSLSTASSLPRSTAVYVGLRNLGNTCFMNSILQCVAHTPKFIDRLLASIRSDTNSHSKLRGHLAASFGELMGEMRGSQGVVVPDDVKMMVGKWAPQFSGYNQQDAHEFLRFLLDGLHEDLNRVATKESYRELKCGNNYSKVASEWFQYNKSRDDSIVMDFFRGQLLTVITCSHCNQKSAACDTFMDLSIPIAGNGGNVRLEACLAEFIAESEVDDYKCESCKKTSRSRMEMTIWKFPPILVIHLKRFSNSSWRRQKIDTPVSFPCDNLNMSSFAPHSTDPSARNPVYYLFGVSHHIGGLAFGHYVA